MSYKDALHRAAIFATTWGLMSAPIAQAVTIPSCYLISAAVKGRSINEERNTMLMQANLWNQAVGDRSLAPAVVADINRRLALLQQDILRVRDLSRGADPTNPANLPRYDWYVPQKPTGPTEPINTDGPSQPTTSTSATNSTASSAGPGQRTTGQQNEKATRPVVRATGFTEDDAGSMRAAQDLSEQLGALKSAPDAILFGLYSERGFTVPRIPNGPLVIPEFVNLFDRDSGRMVATLQGNYQWSQVFQEYQVELTLVMNASYAGPSTFKALLDPILAKWRERGAKTILRLQMTLPSENPSAAPGADGLMTVLRDAGFTPTVSNSWSRDYKSYSYLLTIP